MNNLDLALPWAQRCIRKTLRAQGSFRMRLLDPKRVLELKFVVLKSELRPQVSDFVFQIGTCTLEIHERVIEQPSVLVSVRASMSLERWHIQSSRQLLTH